MPSQQQETLEMISNLKKALRREKEPPSSQPIYGISNRGNKLKLGANLVHLGSLANTNGPEPYKQKIEHAGYSRYILERNPTRYDDFGDELLDYDSAEESNTHSVEIDPYEGIKLEELLRPLTHPSELATHPTLSLPYLDPALPDMIKTAEEKLRQERANLWRAKALNRQLLGDMAWMPLCVVESPDDWDLFEPRPANATVPPNKKRKLNGEAQPEHVDIADVDQIGVLVNGADVGPVLTTSASGEMDGDENVQDTLDVEMEEAVSAEQRVSEAAKLDEDTVNTHTPADTAKRESESNANGAVEVTLAPSDKAVEDVGMDNETKETEGPAAEEDQESEIQRGSGESSPAPPPRRITRALAAGNNGNSRVPSPPQSPSPTLTASDSSLLQVDPIFLLPPEIQATNRVSALYGLAADEAVETRKLLTAYIQKQEECVRGLETLAAKLIAAMKLRKEVWDMCKAEGHEGELSDGEDWIDAEAWGLKEGELRKGRFEEEDIQEEREAIGGGRKGKRRRREQN